MATGDILRVDIISAGVYTGWCADVVVENVASATFGTFNFGTPGSTAASNFYLEVASESWNEQVPSTRNRIVYGTKAVRQPYSNESDVEATADGSDLIVRVSLSDYVFELDENPEYTIKAGWWDDGSVTNTAATGTAVNGSTVGYPTAIGQWDLVNGEFYTIVDSGFTVGFHAFHAFGTCGVAFTATGVSSAVSQTEYVSAPTVHQYERSGLYGESHKAFFNLTSFQNGEPINIRAEVFPYIGGTTAKLDTDVNGTAYKDITYLDSQNQVLCNKSEDQRAFAVVATGGNDGTGQSSNSLATAETTPFLTIAAAMNASQTSVPPTDIYVKAGTFDYLGAAPSAETYSFRRNIRAYPGTSPTLNRGSNVDFNQKWLAWNNFTITGNAFGDGNNGERFSMYVGCTFASNSGGVTGLGYRSYGCAFINCFVDGNEDLDQFSSVRMKYHFIGNNFGSTVGTSCDIVHTAIGNSGATARLDYDGYRVGPMRNPVFYNNYCVDGNTTTSPVSNHADFVSNGLAFVGNVFEATTDGSAVVYMWADANLIPMHNVLFSHNTVIGDRCNLFYNDNVSGAVYRSNIYMTGNALESFNTKHDVFNNPTYGQQGSRIGTWAFLHGVGCKDNRYDSTESAAFIQDFSGINTEYVTGVDATTGQLGYTNDESASGNTDGFGDYTPITTGTPSPLYLGMSYGSVVGAFDFLGGRRYNEIGAIEVVETTDFPATDPATPPITSPVIIDSPSFQNADLYKVTSDAPWKTNEYHSYSSSFTATVSGDHRHYPIEVGQTSGVRFVRLQVIGADDYDVQVEIGASGSTSRPNDASIRVGKNYGTPYLQMPYGENTEIRVRPDTNTPTAGSAVPYTVVFIN